MTIQIDNEAQLGPIELMERARQKYTLAQARVRRGPPELALLSLHGSLEDGLRARAIYRKLSGAGGSFTQLLEGLKVDDQAPLSGQESDVIARIHRLRARVAHGEQITVADESILSYQRLVARLLLRYGVLVVAPEEQPASATDSAGQPTRPITRIGRSQPQAAAPEARAERRPGENTREWERRSQGGERRPGENTREWERRSQGGERRPGEDTREWERSRPGQTRGPSSTYPLLDRYPDLSRRPQDEAVVRAEGVAGFFGRTQSWILPALILLSVFLIGLLISFGLQPRGASPLSTAAPAAASTFAPDLPSVTAEVNSIGVDGPAAATPAEAELPTLAPTDAPSDTLATGRLATVFEGIPALNLRSDATNEAPILLSIAPGTEVEVIDGPREAEGFTWWKVRVAGKEGWCAGEYLQPR